MPSAFPIAQETASYLSSLTHVLGLEKKTLLVICCSQEEVLQRLTTEVTILPSQQSQILFPTIARISAGKNIEMVFTASLMHLRAFLSSLITRKQASKDLEMKALAILGLPALHLSNNDLNAQSLSRTLALAIEAGSTAGGELLFLCPRKSTEEWQGNAAQNCVWETRMPVLASSVRSDDRAWNWRNVVLGDVFAQWCAVIKVDT